jgi:hypothetical protein
MRTLAFIIFAVSLTSVPVSVQSNAKAKCPAGYELVGAYCQSNSTGDVVLPN